MVTAYPVDVAARLFRLGLRQRFSAPGGGAAGSVVGRARVADELGAPRGPLPIPGGDLDGIWDSGEALRLDAVLLAGDNLALEIAVAQFCLHFGVPLYHAAVHGETLTAEYRVLAASSSPRISSASAAISAVFAASASMASCNNVCWSW